jgi:hypothetical protein
MIRALTAGMLVWLAIAGTARALPPTVTVSPGYDARLAESRKALQAQPPAPPAQPARKRKPPARR